MTRAYKIFTVAMKVLVAQCPRKMQAQLVSGRAPAHFGPYCILAMSSFNSMMDVKYLEVGYALQ